MFDMGMSHVVVAGRRIWVPGHDAVKPGRVAGGSPVKTDVEPPEVDSFQVDRLSRDKQLRVVPVAIHAAEFRLKRREVANELPAVGQPPGRRGNRTSADLGEPGVDLRPQLRRLMVLLVCHAGRRPVPSPLFGAPDPPADANKVFQSTDGRARDYRSGLLPPGQFSPNRHCHGDQRTLRSVHWSGPGWWRTKKRGLPAVTTGRPRTMPTGFRREPGRRPLRSWSG
jgi:hypothetical protein